MTNKQINSLTIDIEDYFQVSNFSKVINFPDWDKYECRVERNTFYLLNILDEFNVKGTFFVLGWIAERYSDLIKKIHKEGHEIASHGYSHKLLTLQTCDEFREDVRKSKKILEDITGKDVIGYRAPSFSLNKKSLWALEILKEEGFEYDSSIFPMRWYRFSTSDKLRFPFILNGNLSDLLNCPNSLNKLINSLDTYNSIDLLDDFIIEFPISTIRIFVNNFPVAGGGYFRLFPYKYTKWGLNKINMQEKKPFIFYIHPWEFDENQPSIKGVSVLSKFRHYINLNKTEVKIRKLLNDFNFSRVKDVLGIP
jgi:polysaccharide deacetylase family protein (PEP-CTERM system associated)